MRLLDNLQPNGSRLPAELTPRVPALVTEEAVVVVVRSRPHRDDNHAATARSQDAEDLLERRRVVGNVLEKIRAHDRVHGAIAKRERTQSAWINWAVGTSVCAFARPEAIRSTPTSVTVG